MTDKSARRRISVQIRGHARGYPVPQNRGWGRAVIADNVVLRDAPSIVVGLRLEQDQAIQSERAIAALGLAVDCEGVHTQRCRAA